MEPTALHPDKVYLALAIGIVIGSFFIYYSITNGSGLLKLLRAEQGSVRVVIVQRLAGCLLFGGLPVMLIRGFTGDQLWNYGLLKPGMDTYWWSLLISAVILVINFLNARSPENLKMYPQIRARQWPLALVAWSAFTWIAYLLAYEFLFRGFLLSVSLWTLGYWPAIALNVILYSVVHFPKGIKEAVGALPYGFLLAVLTIETGTLWLAVLTHIVMALSNEWLSLRAHPDMKITLP